MLPDPEESVLHQLLRFVRVPHDPMEGTAEPHVLLREETLERLRRLPVTLLNETPRRLCCHLNSALAVSETRTHPG
jgi:hypothetical protein